MAPVTVKTTANVAGGSGNTGWSARSLFAVTVPEIAPNVVSIAITSGGFGLSSSNNEVAQSFTPGSSFSLAYIYVIASNFGSASDNFTCEIQTDNAGVPSNTAVTNGVSTAYAATALTSAVVDFKIEWPTPPSLTSGTKYWMVFKRSGSVTDSNAVLLRRTSADSYASQGFFTRLSGTWSATANSDLVFAMYSTTATSAVYAVVQDTALHVYQSTDNGGSWTEQDSGAAPSVNSATKPFGATYTRYGGIIIQYFSGTNTSRLRLFTIPANTWETTDLQNANATTDADFNRNVRPLYAAGRTYGLFTSLADDADLRYVTRTNGSWSANTNLLAVTDADASSFLDAVGAPDTSVFVSMFWQDISTDTVKVQTMTGTTQGTATNIDATGADTEAEHASGAYEVYYNGTNSRAIVAFIDADGTLEERILTLGVTAASISQATQHEVSAATTYAGRQLATCVYGSDAYIFASTGTGIDYFKDAGIAGSWSSAVNWKSGLTNCYLASVTPISGVGILVIYNDNGDVKVDLLAPSVAKNDTDTISPTATEAESLAAAAPDTDTVSPTLAEADTIAAAALDTDTVSPTLTEADTIAAVISDTDTVSPTLSEAESIAISTSKNDTDTVSPTLSEVDSVSAALSDSDTVTPTLSEATSRVAAAADTDTVAPTITEADTVAAALPSTDTVSPTLSEAESLTQSATDTDTVAPAFSESDTISVSAPSTETISPTMSEAELLSAALPDTDTVSPTLAEVSSVLIVHLVNDTDTVSPTLSESESTTIAIADSDIVTIVWGESDVVTASFSETDTIAPVLNENEAVTFDAIVLETDTLNPTLDEVEAILVLPVTTIIVRRRSLALTAQGRTTFSVANTRSLVRHPGRSSDRE